MSWHPAVKANTVDKDNKVGSVRTLDLGGPKLVEQLVSYSKKGHSYTYRFTKDPGNVATIPAAHYISTITVSPAKHHTTLVTWTGSFTRVDPSAKPAAGQDNDSAIKAVSGVYRGGLDALKAKAEGK